MTLTFGPQVSVASNRLTKMVKSKVNQYGYVPVESAEAPTIQDSISSDETVVATHEDAILISDTTYDREEVHLSEIDSKPGRVRILSIDEIDGEERVQSTDMTFEEFRTARLAFGLWVECGPFHQPESSNSVPVEVAAAGKAYLAAYLRIGNGYPLARSAVADKIGVTDQTVSNYCNRVRWTPDA